MIAVAAQYPNAAMARTPYDALAYPEPLDVVFTAQNYHDMPITEYNLGTARKMNATAFAALKPGGVYVVIDHSAVDGAPVGHEWSAPRCTVSIKLSCAAKWKRPASCSTAKAKCCAIPPTTRTTNVFDPAIRGHTDQFMMRFRKPG